LNGAEDGEGDTRRHLSARATWDSNVPEILAVAGSFVAFFLLPEWPGAAAVLGLVGGVAAAVIATSTAKAEYSPADMTAAEKRRLRVVTSVLVICGSLAALATAFLLPPHLWLGSALVGSYLPSFKALLVFNASFFLGVGLVLAYGLFRRAEGRAE